jgi:hypothetical protein
MSDAINRLAIEDAINVVATERSLALPEACDWIFDRVAASDLNARGICDEGAGTEETFIKPYWVRWIAAFGEQTPPRAEDAPRQPIDISRPAPRGIVRPDQGRLLFDRRRAIEEEEARTRNRQRRYADATEREIPPGYLRDVTVDAAQLKALLSPGPGDTTASREAPPQTLEDAVREEFKIRAPGQGGCSWELFHRAVLGRCHKRADDRGHGLRTVKRMVTKLRQSDS